MQIKRYEITSKYSPGMFRILDKLKDGFVSIPLSHDSAEVLEEIMGKDMEELVDSDRVHPDYLKEV